MKISFRVSTHLWMEEARLRDLLGLLDRYRDTVTEVACFTGATHPPLPEHVVRERASRLAEVLPRFRALGLSAGINHLATLGHMDENLPNSLREPLQRLVDIGGAESPGCFCASDPRMQDYLRACYTALAGARPDFIWVDDDVRLEGHNPRVGLACFCERCLADFSTQTGRTWSREALREAFRTGPQPERLALRRQWLAHNRAYITRVLDLVREAVDAADPAMPLGLMTGDIYYSGLAFDEWAAALGGPRAVEVRWRPGGGFYTDDAPLALLTKAHNMGRQVAQLPRGMRDIQYEHENFPYQVLRKSATIFGAETAAALGAGCTGVALNCMGITPDPFSEYEPCFAVTARLQGLYQRAADAFKRSPCEGVWPAWTRDHMAGQAPGADWAEASPWGGDLAYPNEYAALGIPFAYAREGAAAALLSGDSVLDFTQEELRGLLAGGVLMDGPALARLHEADLGEHTGFAVAGIVPGDATEVFTADPVNGAFGGWRRDCRTSIWGQPTHLLRPLDPAARPLAEVIDFTPATLGICAGVYENRLGGRVAVLGYCPWASVSTLAKATQLKALCRWLSRDALPAVVASFHRAAVWCRRDAGGRPALMVLNASIDPVRDVALLVRGEWTGADVQVGPARPHRIHAANPEPGDGPCTRLILPPLGPWEPALVEMRG